MDYVTYDQSGVLTGGYCQPVHPDHAANHIAVTADIRLNWTAYRANAARNGVEVAPVVPVGPVVPDVVPKLNARLALLAAGYWDDVVAFTSEQGPVAIAFLEDALTIRRDNELVNAWAASRGKAGELDALFIAAGAMEV